MPLAAWILVGLGAAFSAFLWANDLRSAFASGAYEGMRRFGPEPHVLSALATGAGAWLLAGAWWGAGVGAGHVALAVVIQRVVRDR